MTYYPDDTQHIHFAGVASKSNVTKGVPRVEEILSLSENPKKPALTIALHHEDETDRAKAQSVMTMVEHTKLGDVVSAAQICLILVMMVLK